jgi:quinol monooxygenase YgiN
MIVVIYQLDVLAHKHKEFIQAVPALLDNAPQQDGCLAHHLCQDHEDPGRFFVVQKWAGQPQLDTAWCNDRFGAFMGTFHLLKTEPTVEIHAVTFTAGIEAIRAVRTKCESTERDVGNPTSSETS